MSVERFLQRSHLAKFPFAFIVTYGRSGSTLLQGIMNAIPGYCVRGENFSALFYLFVAAQRIQDAQRKFAYATDPRSPWFGAHHLDPNVFSKRLADAFLDTCLRPFPDTRCVGFKEIRYLQSEIPDEMFSAYLDFLQAVYPGAALIFNLRDVVDTANSGWWQAQDANVVEQQLIDASERFQSYAAGRPNCILFSYNSLIENPGYSKTLFDFLGEPFDLEALKRLLVRRHSFPTPRADEPEAFEEPLGDSKSSEASIIIARLRKSVAAKSAAIEELRKESASQSRQLRDLQIRLKSMQESTSWQLTSPIRKLLSLRGRAQHAPHLPRRTGDGSFE